MIYDKKGQRKYLNPKERNEFIKAARKLPLNEQTFCLVLAYSGCRISEALELTCGRIDVEDQVVIIKTLKKRRSDIFRSIPMPSWVLARLQAQIEVVTTTRDGKLWPWSRTTGWLVVKRAMTKAGVSGGHACPKGLRHGFGIAAIQSEVPLNMVQKWLGHSKIETTAIYTNAVGLEELEIARRMWR